MTIDSFRFTLILSFIIFDRSASVRCKFLTKPEQATVRMRKFQRPVFRQVGASGSVEFAWLVLRNRKVIEHTSSNVVLSLINFLPQIILTISN